MPRVHSARRGIGRKNLPYFPWQVILWRHLAILDGSSPALAYQARVAAWKAKGTYKANDLQASAVFTAEQEWLAAQVKAGHNSRTAAALPAPRSEAETAAEAEEGWRVVGRKGHSYAIAVSNKQPAAPVLSQAQDDQLERAVQAQHAATRDSNQATAKAAVDAQVANRTKALEQQVKEAVARARSLSAENTALKGQNHDLAKELEAVRASAKRQQAAAKRQAEEAQKTLAAAREKTAAVKAAAEAEAEQAAAKAAKAAASTLEALKEATVLLREKDRRIAKLETEQATPRKRYAPGVEGDHAPLAAVDLSTPKRATNRQSPCKTARRAAGALATPSRKPLTSRKPLSAAEDAHWVERRAAAADQRLGADVRSAAKKLSSARRALNGSFDPSAGACADIAGGASPALFISDSGQPEEETTYWF